MGVFENPDFQAGTIGVMDAIVKQPGVKSIIGGGDSAAAAINLGRADKFSWISTGGRLLLWSFSKVKYCQVWLHLQKNNFSPLVSTKS